MCKILLVNLLCLIGEEFDERIENTITELCKYYMEFLESDFRSNRLPSRRIEFDIEEGKKLLIYRSIMILKVKRLSALLINSPQMALKSGKINL